MSYKLPFNPYMTNIVNYYAIEPSDNPLKIYVHLKEQFGARAVGQGSWDSDIDWEFDTEQERTLFALRWS